MARSEGAELCPYHYHKTVHGGPGPIEAGPSGIRTSWRKRTWRAQAGPAPRSHSGSRASAGEPSHLPHPPFHLRGPGPGAGVAGRHACAWGLENSLYWVLEVILREDEGRLRQGLAALNLAFLRRIAHPLLHRHTSTKRGIENKRLIAGRDLAYTEEILGMGDCAIALGHGLVPTVAKSPTVKGHTGIWNLRVWPNKGIQANTVGSPVYHRSLGPQSAIATHAAPIYFRIASTSLPIILNMNNTDDLFLDQLETRCSNRQTADTSELA